MLLFAFAGDASASPFGVMTDVGVPDGATISVVYRPISPVRVSIGASHNYVGPGVRAGITLTPIPWWLSPTLSVSAGHFAERDANPLARMIIGDDSFSSEPLEQVGYDYADAHLGLAFGRRRATFYIDGGVSRIVGNVRNLGAEGEMVSVTYTEDPTITLATLSARVGFIIYIP
jgi:hypothetical protein